MNAIILAAGLGSRFKDVTKTIHKALLPLKDGTPNIERTIEYLIDANIKDIYIVTGHLAYQFEYLRDKYNCHLINNHHYDKYNNIFSFMCAVDYFGDSFVIDSDVTLFNNIFLDNLQNSCYYLIQRPKGENKEWVPVIINGRIKNIRIDNSYSPSLLGVSYWTKTDSNIIKEYLKNYSDEKYLLDPKLYWDNIPMELLECLDIRAKLLAKLDAYEIDNLEEYNFMLELSSFEK